MKILIVSLSQFGYLIDYHRYYTYLKGKGHDVQYISWDFGKERLEPGNPDIIYVPREGGMVRRLPRLISAVVKQDKKINYDRILINNFKMVSSLLLFIPNKKMYLDIRQVSVHTKKYKRALFDGMMQFAAKRFKNTSIITDLAAKHIGISRYKLLPLGGAYFSPSSASDANADTYRNLFTGNDFIFLYVGTLTKRRMIDCVTGFHEYLKKHPQTSAKFLLVGDGYGDELKNIKTYITENKLDNYVFALGYIPQQRLAIFFQEADCGVTYFPITPFNDVQPNTKTYEYLINGIPVIATATKDNVKLLTTSGIPCGIVIDDNANEFERGVGEIINNKDQYSKKAIAEKFSEYEWDNLFREYLDNVLDLPQQKRAVAI
jgi:glycosyltransferase involved in cell wall biosynthesis